MHLLRITLSQWLKQVVISTRYDNLRYGFDSNPEGYEWNSYFSKIRNNFGDEVKRRIMIGSHVLLSGYYAKYYLKAQKVRSILRQEFKKTIQTG